MLANPSPAFACMPAVDTGSRIEESIEAICQLGCREVSRRLECLARGESFLEVEGLNRAERDTVLGELREVMSVYGNRCQLD